MASPRKRQKFASLHHSTPQDSSQDETTVSTVSTINTMEEQAFERKTFRRRLLNENKENEPLQNLTLETRNTQYSSRRSSTHISTSSEENDDYIGEDYDNYFKDSIRIQYTGKIWKLYKPVKEKTLYANIVEDPANVNIIITELLVDYKDCPGDVITSLIQLFVDLTGFNFDVSNHYNLSNYRESSLKIIQLLETDEFIEKSDLVMKGKYLFAETNISLAKTFQMGIYNFLQKLVRNLHIKKFLYDKRILEHLFEFIICMQGSLARCIKHTGVIIAMKILTALILVCNDVIKDPDFVMDKLEVMNKPKAAKLLKEKMSLDQFIERFYCIFSKNCRFQDSKLFKMRIECIGEAKIWIKYFPEMFISNFQTVNYIMKLIVDMSKEVRMATLNACEELFLIPQVVNLIKPFIKDFTESIGKRFYDIDLEVSKKAIQIFQLLYQIDGNFISKERFKQIGNLLFSQYTPIAVAASAFFTKFFEKEINSPEETLLIICKLYINKKAGLTFDDNRVKEIIVEVFLHMCEHMQNWELFCKLLFEDTDDETKKVLAELFSESVYQYVNGKSGIKRTIPLCANPLDTSIHENIAQLFPLFNKIFSEQSNPNILNEFLRIIPLVNHYYLEKNYCAEYTIMGNALRIIFNNHVNEMVLKNVAKVMFHLESIPNFATRAKQISNIVCNETIENFTNITDYNEIGSFVVKRLAILYQYYNFNDLLTFGQFAGFIKGVNDSVDLALLACCKWHLIWQLKNTTENAGAMRQTQFDEIISNLKETCKQFFTISFEQLQNEQKNEITVKEVYSIFCDFCCLFDKELEPLVKIYRSFSHLTLKIADKHLQMALVMFLEKNVVSNNNMTLFDRRNYIAKYVDLILIGVMPVQNLVYIFKYYNLYYDQYGPIIDQCLTEFAKRKDYTLDFIVDHTLMNVYEDILKRHSLVDIRTEEATQLKNLAKQFSTIKYFHNSKNLYTFLHILMRDTFREEKYFPFLYFIKPFLNLIDDSETQKKIYTSFKNNIPKGSEKNDVILYFGNALKNIQGKKATPETPMKKVPAKNKERETKKIKRKKGQNKHQSNPKSSGSKTPKKKTKTNEIENEISEEDDMTIQDSDSDDLDGNLNRMQIK